MNTFLAFTSTSYAFGKDANESKQLLIDQLQKNNAKANLYFVASITEGIEVIHYITDEGKVICQTSEGIDIPFQTLRF